MDSNTDSCLPAASAPTTVPNTASTALQEPVNVWSTGDVSAWAKVMDLPKACRTALKPVDGEVCFNFQSIVPLECCSCLGTLCRDFATCTTR